MEKTKLFLLCVCFLFWAGASWAIDFGTAMSITTINIPAGADAHAIATDASNWGYSSNNPAMAAYQKPDQPNDYGLASTFGLLNFSHGPTIRFTIDSASVKTKLGFFQATISYFDSDLAFTKMGAEAEFCPSKVLELVWANKIVESWLKPGDELYLGLEVSYSKSKLNFKLPEYGRILQSDSIGNDLMIGFLYKPTSKVNIGGYYTRMLERSREKDYLFKTFESEKSISHQFKFGASYQILPQTFVACDVQFLNIAGTKKTQLFTGIEQGVIKDVLYLYAGVAHKSPTCGLGLYFENGGINISYAHNASVETNIYLGKSKLVMFSFYLTF